MKTVLVVGSADDQSLPAPYLALAVAAEKAVRSTLVEFGCAVRFVDTAHRPLPPLEEAFEGAAGLVLLGGGDVDPAVYGLPSDLPHLYGVSREVDDYGIGAVHAAHAAGLPILGICRGAQILNVAHGGTLIPDLENWKLHRGPTVEDTFVSEPVVIEKDSRLCRALAVSSADVQNGHHQAVDRVGDGLRAVAWAGDGVVEAVEADADHPDWVVGIQWHPEHAAADPEHLIRLFDAFVSNLACVDDPALLPGNQGR